MIWTGYAGALGIRSLVVDHDGEPMFGAVRAEMPWMTYFRGLGAGSPRERALADRVSGLGMWRALHWEPECAEKVMGWIATGSWTAGGDQTKRAATGLTRSHSGLLGPDGELL